MQKMHIPNSDKPVANSEKYLIDGVESLKYHLNPDAQKELGEVERIRSTFFEFQKILY